VSDPLMNLHKSLSLLLGLRRNRLPPHGRAFIWANLIPTITAVGALYLMAA
jgi:hypothetical protein